MPNSRIGAEQLTLAKMLSDTAGGSTTYDTPRAIIKKLISVGLKGSPTLEKQYADDQAVDIISDDGDITVDISITDLTEDEKAYILGQTMMAGIRTPGDEDRPYFAAMWKSRKRSGAYKYYKLLKVMFSEPDETFATKGATPTPQPDSISGTAIKRFSDGLRKRVADSESSTYVSSTGANWFASGDINPDTDAPTVAISPVDAAPGVAIGSNVVWTFSKPILASLVTDAPDETNPYFFLLKADGTIVAGSLSINTDRTIVTFDPTTDLTAATAHVAVCTTGVRDLSGNHLAAQSVTNFTTA